MLGDTLSPASFRHFRLFHHFHLIPHLGMFHLIAVLNPPLSFSPFPPLRHFHSSAILRLATSFPLSHFYLFIIFVILLISFVILLTPLLVIILLFYRITFIYYFRYVRM